MAQASSIKASFWFKTFFLIQGFNLIQAVLTCSGLKKVTFYIIQTPYNKPLLVESFTASIRTAILT